MGALHMGRKKSKVVSIADHKSSKAFMRLAEEYAENLPAPSATFPNIIFLYDEGLAVAGRELLFRQLNSLAEQNNQKLVVTDVGHDRTGLYINLDEIGEGKQEVDYEERVHEWDSRTS
jgi:hypothetical protein